ncbi:MAG: IS3 family transposase, partial [Shewanella oncorhynchi]
LKLDWIFKVSKLSRPFMKYDITAYMKYYNLEQLHSANGDLSPIEFENSELKVVQFGLNST